MGLAEGGDGPPISQMWRMFRVDDFYGSPNLAGSFGDIWITAEKHAECHRLRKLHQMIQVMLGSNMETGPPLALHDAPAEHCECGIYGFYEAMEVYRQYIIDNDREGIWQILARCTFWGKTIVGDKGIRTEYAEIQKGYVIMSRSAYKPPPIPWLETTFPTVEWIPTSRTQLLTTIAG